LINNKLTCASQYKGWRVAIDLATGNKYYYNGMITTWDKPADFDDATTSDTQGSQETTPEGASDTNKSVTMISGVEGTNDKAAAQSEMCNKVNSRSCAKLRNMFYLFM
jgi:hypothetical protein